MKAVVDTNVVAYYLLGTEPFVEEVRQFWRTVEEACAPAHWEAELANAVWMAVRTGVLPTRKDTRNSTWRRGSESSRLPIDRCGNPR